MWMIVPLLILALVLSIIYWSIRNGISPMPSTRKQAKAMISLLPSPIQGRIADLGSGWGTLAIALAQQLPECRITGYENSPIPLYASKLIARIARLSNLELIRADLLSISLSDFQAIVCYLHPAAMRKLQTKLEVELPAGTPIICNTFAMAGWKPEEVIRLDDLYHTQIYFYRMQHF
jgi:16S RNA G1207 methylase RsmC